MVNCITTAMRGSQSIYNTLFKDESVPVPDTTAPERRGRSEVLKTKQNELIVCRYYYYIKLQERQYEKTLELLRDEVFLAERTLVDIINRHSGQLKELHKMKPDLKFFRSKYPHLNWSTLFQ